MAKYGAGRPPEAHPPGKDVGGAWWWGEGVEWGVQEGQVGGLAVAGGGGVGPET